MAEGEVGVPPPSSAFAATSSGRRRCRHARHEPRCRTADVRSRSAPDHGRRLGRRGKSVLLSSWVAAGHRALLPRCHAMWLTLTRSASGPGSSRPPRACRPDSARMPPTCSRWTASCQPMSPRPSRTVPRSCPPGRDRHGQLRQCGASGLREHDRSGRALAGPERPAPTGEPRRPALRLPRLRLSGELCELRDRDLYFTLAESGDLLASFGVALAPDEQALLHQRREGSAAALQMAALSLRGTGDPPGHAALTSAVTPSQDISSLSP